MKIILVVSLIVLFAFPAMAQDTEDPSSFIWAGAGLDRYEPREDSGRLPSGVFGYGHRIKGDSYTVTNIVMTEERSTISQAFLQRITTQGPLGVFAFGDIGVESGNKTTTLSLGAAIGIDFDLGLFSKKIKNLKPLI